MTTFSVGQDLLRTRLHRPRVTADLVHRPRLKQALNSGLDRPLILVTAPAGFGKTTLLSAWLETSDLPHAWISLDPVDDDLGAFLAYVVAAVQSLFPGALPETRSFLTGLTLPALSVIAANLLNELDDLGRDFILVLDDLHVVHDQSIHELLSLLLQYPPQGMHLVIATRLEPPLPLALYRARNMVAEIRGQDLRFSRAEIAAFAEQTLGAPLAAGALAALAEKTEGWAVGLRFAALTLRQSRDVDNRFVGLDVENRYVLDYLTHEVLALAPPGVRSFLLKTSILDQVCAPLGKAVIGADDLAFDPQEGLAWLEQANMFTVALDSRGEWYRYHHLFQELLRQQLAREASDEDIAALHARASAWYADQGSLVEALQYALQGHDVAAAVRLVAEQRHALMNAEQWQLYQRALNKFPEEAVAAYPDLILMSIWIDRLARFSPARCLELIDLASSLVALMSDQPEHADRLSSEIDAVRAAIASEAVGEPAATIALAQRSLATTPRAWYHVRCTAWLSMAFAYQLAGRLDQAYAVLAEGSAEDVAPDGAVHARLAGSRCVIEWIAGDLPAVKQGAAHVRAMSELHQQHETHAWALVLLSSVAYEHNDLATAEAYVKGLEDMRYLGKPIAYLQSEFIRALIHQARGQHEEAQQRLAFALSFLPETHSEDLAPLVQAFQADLAARQGDLGAARHWATTIAPFVPLGWMPFFYAPQMTLPKILLAQNTPDSLAQAAGVLARLHDFVTATHNTHFTIEVLALQALLHDALGEEQAALERLQQAVALAEPGGFIRRFVDLGPRLANLLGRLRPAGSSWPYVDQILKAFGASTPATPHFHMTMAAGDHLELVEPLTRRELEILALLAQRKSNREIAEMLVISMQTVKRHLSNIYGKLQVNTRREAVAKATQLGLL